MVQVYYCGFPHCVCTYAEYMAEFHDLEGPFTYEWIKEER